ncbi:MAG TPA: hypothetical protein VKA21_01265 [Candidatus Binatia bacterium]|nr:hypothetical protein [Candidatus Binatia bacterium]
MRRAVGILSTTIGGVFAATVALAGGPFLGEHTMTGRIVDLDKDKGRVTVEAQGEELDLHFPRSALQNLNEGDQVTVSLAISPVAGTAGRSGTPASPGR